MSEEDGEVERAIWDLREHRAAPQAAELLLREAALLIESGQLMPRLLRNLLVEMLDHFARTDPLAAFPWLREPRLAHRPNQNDESAADRLEHIAILVRKHQGGSPLILPEDADDVAGWGRSAFYLAAREIYPDADEPALRRAARNLKSRWLTFPSDLRSAVLRVGND